MKNKNTYLSLITFVVIVFGFLSCGNQTSANTEAKAEVVVSDIDSSNNELRAYYFHATRRCATCQAVESVVVEALKEFYGDKIVLQLINRDEEKENPLLAKYKVSGQTLLIVKGSKVINLTNDAFMNARSNPEKLKETIKVTIDPLM